MNKNKVQIIVHYEEQSNTVTANAARITGNRLDLINDKQEVYKTIDIIGHKAVYIIHVISARNTK